MIDLLIYHLHLIGAAYAFTKRWQDEGVRSGLMAVILIGLVFTIVWALMGPIARLILPNSAAGDILTSDTLSLLLTLAVEAPFFLVFFLRNNQD